MRVLVTRSTYDGDCATHKTLYSVKERKKIEKLLEFRTLKEYRNLMSSSARSWKDAYAELRIDTVVQGGTLRTCQFRLQNKLYDRLYDHIYNQY